MGPQKKNILLFCVYEGGRKTKKRNSRNENMFWETDIFLSREDTLFLMPDSVYLGESHPR